MNVTPGGFTSTAHINPILHVSAYMITTMEHSKMKPKCSVVTKDNNI